MYTLFKGLLLSLLKAPTEPPEPPAGSGYASVQVFRASPRFLVYRLLWLGIFAAVAAAALSIVLVVALANGQPGVAGGLIAIVAVVVFSLSMVYFGVRIDYDLRYYLVTDRSLRVREGAWNVKEMTLTYANVQNLRITQGPIERLLKISNLQVDTAGGGVARKGQEGGTGHTVTIAGVENAREIRDEIREHLKARGAGGGLGDLDDRERVDATRAAGRASAGAALASPALRAALAEVRDAARDLRVAAQR